MGTDRLEVRCGAVLMPLIDNYGRPYTWEELAADYAKDLRVWCGMTPEQVEDKVSERYPRYRPPRPDQGQS
jgi:hypothetical protein